MLLAILKLIGLTALGYILFKPRVMYKKVLPLFTFAMISLLFPLYSITRYGMGWEGAVVNGFFWPIVFFFMSLLAIAVQYLLVRLLTRSRRLFPQLLEHNRNEFFLLFAVHNAGYMPLPILQAIAPPEITVYMFSYILAFNLLFWSFAVSVVRSGQKDSGFKLRFKLNPPLVGLLLGLLLAATGLYQKIPRAITAPVEQISSFSMDGILIVLGGILSGVPHHRLRAHGEFFNFAFIRQLLYPLVVLIFCVLIRLALGDELVPGGNIRLEDTLRWLQLVLVIQAAVPPATNLAIVAKAYGDEEQHHYMGSGLILSYLASALLLPLFVAAAYYI